MQLNEDDNYTHVTIEQPLNSLTRESVSFVVISDTHQYEELLPQLPSVDVLIHTGDFTNFGLLHEAVKFNRWLGRQSHIPVRILIAGNHENIADALTLTLTNCTHYLLDQSVTIHGIKIYGSRFKPFWSWPRMKDNFSKTRFDDIPLDTNIVLAHQPPSDINGLDVLYDGTSRGSEALRKRIDAVKPLISICGHNHAAFGSTIINNTVFINAASLPGSKKNVTKMNKPIVFTINKS
jgi:Icc-related predicted phosphoesterase